MSVNGASLVEGSQLKSACGAQLALEFSSALMHGEDFAEVSLKKAARCFTGNGVERCEGKRGKQCNDRTNDSHAELWWFMSSLISAQSGLWSTPLPEKQGAVHGEMELEIVIIDKHFSYDRVCPATRKLQGCCSKLSAEATGFICLWGASMHSHKLRSINDAESHVGNWWSFLEYFYTFVYMDDVYW